MRYQLRYIRNTLSMSPHDSVPQDRRRGVRKLYRTPDAHDHPGWAQLRSFGISLVNASSTSTQRCSLPGRTTS